MKTDINLTGWDQITISQKVDRDLKVYKKTINWMGNNLDVVAHTVALLCFIGAIILLKAMMVPYPVPA